MSDSTREVLRLAKEHMIARHSGGNTLGKNRSAHYKYKTVISNCCHRPMDVREHENPPYYCWRCSEECECAQR